jgi:prepilin-type processing-associated H-X9-DG protein
MRRVRLLVVAVLAAAMLVGGSGTASAQGWMYHPNSGNYWYCDYYGSEFWCYATEMGLWVRAHSPEMMQQVDGWQPV